LAIGCSLPDGSGGKADTGRPGISRNGLTQAFENKIEINHTYLHDASPALFLILKKEKFRSTSRSGSFPTRIFSQTASHHRISP
jgi:hypothetical protein